jgi:hypothetical protein
MRLLPRTLDANLRLSAALIVLGLVIALPTLFWTHALSFLLFTGVSAMLVGLGVLVYLLALARFTRALESEPANAPPSRDA